MSCRPVLAVLLLTVFSSSPAAEKDPTSDLVVRGSAISKEEVDRGDPVATWAKDEILAVVRTGKPACRNGSVGASFDAGKFSSGGETFTLDQTVERLRELKGLGKVSCFRVQARHYDKLVYLKLQKALVDENQISLFWDETK